MDQTEIERKFLLARIPDLPTARRRRIDQGYLVHEGAELRIRRKERTCTMTAKSLGGLSRQEWETQIPTWVFESLWPSTEGARVSKERYTVADGRHILEVDIFLGDLEGLCLLEVEFKSEKHAREFRLPSWVPETVDVTEDSRFKNRKLALEGRPEEV